VLSSVRRSSPATDVLEAALRPKAVVAMSERAAALEELGWWDEAILPLPDHLSKGARYVAHAVAGISTRRLKAGWSLAYALRTAALGRDKIVTELQEHGISMDRKTVSYCLLELAEAGVIERTGQLGAWTNPDAQDGHQVIQSGSFTYALRVKFRQLGDLALAALLKNATSWGNKTQNRAHRALEWAQEHAQPGSRNAIGYWLARRFIDSGLTEGDARPLMRMYAAPWAAHHEPYRLREALATLRSAYRRHGLPR
jgi:hypothetical protein